MSPIYEALLNCEVTVDNDDFIREGRGFYPLNPVALEPHSILIILGNRPENRVTAGRVALAAQNDLALVYW
jgi:hypothetical protein